MSGRSLNVFVIPSWYPNQASPVSGIFFKEQAMAIGRLRPDWQVAVSLWNQGQNDLPLRAPRTLLRNLRSFLATRNGLVRTLLPNVREYLQPCLVLSERLAANAARNREALLTVNRRNLKRALDDLGGIDVLHAHVSYPAGWVAMHLSREFGIPYVLTEHMGPFPFPSYLESDGTLGDLVREPLLNAHARLSVSPAHASRIASYGVPEPRVVPNLVDEEEFRVPAERPTHAFTFFTLAYLSPEKGILDLLEAISLLTASTLSLPRPLSFRIGGDGPVAEYQARARELGIEAMVTWLGPLSRDQVRAEFQGCDAFVLPSHYESFGMVYAEATACGKPLIATRCGGGEYHTTPENGLLVEVGRPDQLAEALLTMARTMDRYDPRVIRDQFLARFSRPVVVTQLEQVYREVLA